MKRAAGIDRRRSLPQFSEQSLRKSHELSPWTTTSAQPDVWLWADSFTDHFGADIGHAAVELLAAAGLRGAGHPRARLLRASPGSRPASSTRPATDPGATPSTPCTPTSPAACPSSDSSRAAWRRCAATPAELLDDPRAAEVAAGMSTLAELLADRIAAGAGRRRT